MPTIIHEGKLFISVREVMNFMEDFRNSMENKREECLADINKTDLLPTIRDMSIKLTDMDYDYFIECLESNIKQYKDRLEEEANKNG